MPRYGFLWNSCEQLDKVIYPHFSIKWWEQYFQNFHVKLVGFILKSSVYDPKGWEFERSISPITRICYFLITCFAGKQTSSYNSQRHVGN